MEMCCECFLLLVLLKTRTRVHGARFMAYDTWYIIHGPVPVWYMIQSTQCMVHYLVHGTWYAHGTTPYSTQKTVCRMRYMVRSTLYMVCDTWYPVYSTRYTEHGTTPYGTQ